LEQYDLLVLGSGTAGKLLSWTLSKAGMKTANIERKYVGGSCQNIACLPSKNIIQSAKVASYFSRSAEFGITKENWKISMPAVRERKRRMVKGLIEVQLDFYEKSGAELIRGSGRFVEPKTIEVTSAAGVFRLSNPYWSANARALILQPLGPSRRAGSVKFTAPDWS
jgi:pyruvate/2-oxoglutarate dehydrogenase complex dihydrolipoamide dehydrogenase (E3) component